MHNYSRDYVPGDLIMLGPSDIVHTYDTVTCDAGPPEPTRFGLAVEDNVTAIVVGIKEDPDYGGEIELLVGLQRAHMTYPAGHRPELRILTIGDKEC